MDNNSLSKARTVEVTVGHENYRLQPLCVCKVLDPVEIEPQPASHNVPIVMLKYVFEFILDGAIW